MSDSSFIARVVATHGHHNLVEGPSKQIFEARRRGKKADIVVGDQVKCIQSSKDQVAIEEILPRHSLLFRSDELRTKPLAANIDQVAIVFATRPQYNPVFIWKALLASETADIPALVIRNKTDLQEDEEDVRPFIEELRQLGARVIEISVKKNHDQTKSLLSEHFKDKITLLIGQSGMGKSSILNLLIGKEEQKTQEYSVALNLGKQTTTNTRWFDFEGGAIVDSPGFQEFGLAHLTLNDLMRGMPEIRDRVEHCRFVNCRHLKEPGCAVRAALDAGEINPDRYALYQELAQQILQAQKQ